MSTWDFSTGDIVLDNGIRTISGPDKIVQDLEHWLVNELKFNRYHPWMGSHLDSYVGQTPKASVLYDIKENVRECLKTYYEETHVAEMEERIAERGDPYIAIGLADPESMVREWTGLDVYEQAGHIRVHITFTTLYNIEGHLNLEVGV